jgi:hypothetical protein
VPELLVGSALPNLDEAELLQARDDVVWLEHGQLRHL